MIYKRYFKKFQGEIAIFSVTEMRLVKVITSSHCFVSEHRLCKYREDIIFTGFHFFHKATQPHDKPNVVTVDNINGPIIQDTLLEI